MLFQGIKEVLWIHGNADPWFQKKTSNAVNLVCLSLRKDYSQGLLVCFVCQTAALWAEVEHRKAFPCLGHSGLENLPKGSKLNKQKQTVQQASSFAPNKQGAEGSGSKKPPPPPPKNTSRKIFEEACQCFILPLYLHEIWKNLHVVGKFQNENWSMHTSLMQLSQRRTSYRHWNVVQVRKTISKRCRDKWQVRAHCYEVHGSPLGVLRCPCTPESFMHP